MEKQITEIVSISRFFCLTLKPLILGAGGQKALFLDNKLTVLQVSFFDLFWVEISKNFIQSPSKLPAVIRDL
jgi:hypothetical protein